MGHLLYFSRKQFDYLREALWIAETLAGEHYGIFTGDWKRYPYDIRTLEQLRGEEVTDRGFAQLAKYSLVEDCPHRKHRVRDFYRICVQDHVILNALNPEENISLRPLLLYIVTHELVHIIRFNRYIQDYFATGKKREQEEKEVHSITHKLLRDVECEGMEEVVNAYRWARADAPQ